MSLSAANLQNEVISIIADLKNYIKIPVGVSNKHVHLTQHDYDILFPGEPMNMKKKLNQGDDFASDKLVTLVGPKGKMENVRILGPCRKYSQIELSMTDARALGIKAPVRLSGNIEDTPGIKIISPHGELTLDRGVIIAKRHIHVQSDDAKLLGLHSGQKVVVKIESAERTAYLDDCEIRVGDDFTLEMHIDTDEGNTVGAAPDSIGRIVNL
ncbi:MAG: phosphate propanoyltransferase [Lachnospiraceae bacterium]|nr:phosphate propanoyltransferase [Lachnospiraceae bacterium]